MSEDQILEIVTKGDEITWKSLILDLIREERMDPWDVDISKLAKRYLEIVRKMKKHDMRISGKMVLAAAILLRMKSNKFLEEDIAGFDQLLHGEEEEGSLLEALGEEEPGRIAYDKRRLIPRTPQPRKRKVAVHDLIDALQQALEVNRRRLMRTVPIVELPEKKFDITQLMKDLYHRILQFFRGNRQEKLTFKKLVPTDTKEGKVHTFIPLLHLSNDRKIDLEQEEHFGEIRIRLLTEKEVEKELARQET